MNITTFVENYKAKRFMITKNGTDERSEWLRKELEIKTYIPFKEKRKIAEMIVAQNIKEVDGIKKYDDINSYVSLVVASIFAHTNLEFSKEDPIADYDLLAESGLLPQIIAEFQGSHEEIGILLKMAITAELEDNNVNVLVGRFLNNILEKLDGVVDGVKNMVGNVDLKELLGMNFEEEDLAHLKGFLDKMK
jgi:hypothetical protein